MQISTTPPLNGGNLVITAGTEMGFSKVVLPAEVKNYILGESNFSAHSRKYYLGEVDLFEFSLSKPLAIEVNIGRPSFLMVVNLKKSSCILCYQPVGKFRCPMVVGLNNIMVISFKPDWFQYKFRRVPEFEAILQSFSNCETTQVKLGSVGIAQSIFQSLEKSPSGKSGLEDDGYIFLNGCLTKYYNKLKGRAATKQYHENYAAKISEFVSNNFTNDIVNNISVIADMFMVSIRTMDRLSKIAFGRALHEHVIKLRIEYAVELVLNTEKSINEIANLCGYKDAHYFSKAFKQYIGKSPRNFKNKSSLKRRAYRIKR